MYTAAAYSGYMPSHSFPSETTSVVARDGTLSIQGVSQMATHDMRKKTQQIQGLINQGSTASTTPYGTMPGSSYGGGGGGDYGGGGGNNGTTGGEGGADAMTKQAAVGEYTTMVQTYSGMISGLTDAYKTIGQNTK